MARTFAELAAAAKRDPFGWPMPDGETIEIEQPSLNTEREAVRAANAADTLTGGLLAGVRVYAGEENGRRIEQAYAPLPASVLAAVIADMQEHFSAEKPES